MDKDTIGRSDYNFIVFDDRLIFTHILTEVEPVYQPRHAILRCFSYCISSVRGFDVSLFLIIE